MSLTPCNKDARVDLTDNSFLNCTMNTSVSGKRKLDSFVASSSSSSSSAYTSSSSLCQGGGGDLSYFAVRSDFSSSSFKSQSPTKLSPNRW